MPDLGELLSLLRSEDPERRSIGVERAAVAVERLTHAVVASLETAGRNGRYVADHVHRFGTLMVEPLEALLARSQNRDTRLLCALLLLRLHSRAGVEELLSAVGEDSDWSQPAADALAEAGVHEAEAPIVHRLRTIPLERGDEITALLHALRRLERTLPADLVTRFSDPRAPSSARETVQQALELTTRGYRKRP
jgi:hypothetical protein